MLMNGSEQMHSMVVRTSAPDPARARRIYDASARLLGGLTWSNTAGSGRADSNHRTIPQSIKDQWKKLYPDLPVPSNVVFNQQSHELLGAMFVGSRTEMPDLGMGDGHEHRANGLMMQHVWFIPNNMQMAFATREQGAVNAAITAANARAQSGAKIGPLTSK
jgi:hypothetical protein